MLVHHLKVLLDNPHLRHTMGNRGRKQIEDQFSQEVIAKSFISLWKDSAN
jgi:glycosyltransferase involved in cell wall biosynthesis